MIWRKDFGFRVSGAGWYDAAYENSDNPKSGTLPNWPGLRLLLGGPELQARRVQQRGRGLCSLLGGELLDAFVFGNWSIGDTALGVRAGRHTIYWGQSILATGAFTGIAGSMAAMDQGKGLSVPGTEAKELFMPSTKISSTLQLTDSLSLSGYYEFEHLVHRLPGNRHLLESGRGAHREQPVGRADRRQRHHAAGRVSRSTTTRSTTPVSSASISATPSRPWAGWRPSWSRSTAPTAC